MTTTKTTETTNLQTITKFYNLIKGMNGADFYNNIYFTDDMLNTETVIKYLEDKYNINDLVILAVDSMVFDYLSYNLPRAMVEDDLDALTNLLEFIVNPTQEDVNTFMDNLKTINTQMNEDISQWENLANDDNHDYINERVEEYRELLSLFY